MKNKLAIVGIFYDGYYDIWEDFLELFSRNWPDCPYPIYIANQIKKLEFSKTYPVTVLHAGADAEFSRKVQTALESITADYFLLLLEDFFFEKKPDEEMLERCVALMRENGLEYIRFPMPEFLVGNYKRRYQLDSATGLYRIPSSSEYTVSCQPSLWSRDFLRSCIGCGNYNAWVFEGMYTYSKNAHSPEFLEKCRVDFCNPLCLRHGAVQGKILPNVYADFATQGYTFRNHREILSGSQYDKQRLKSKLKALIPQPFLSTVRKMTGSQSVLGRYKNAIMAQMKENGLE